MGDVVSSLLDRLRNLVPKRQETNVPGAFKKYDENSDGIITPEEFERQFKIENKREPGRGDWWDFLAKDRNGDACVSIDEFRST